MQIIPQKSRFTLATHAETYSSESAESFVPNTLHYSSSPFLTFLLSSQQSKHNKAPSLFRVSRLVL